MSLDRQALPETLTRLHLTAIRDQLDSLLDEAAKREFSLREAVAFLCEREVGRRISAAMNEIGAAFDMAVGFHASQKARRAKPPGP